MRALEDPREDLAVFGVVEVGTFLVKRVSSLEEGNEIETRKMLGQDGHNALRVFDKPFAQDGPHGLMRPTLNSRGENHRGSQGGSRGGSSGAPPVGVADGDPSIVSWSRSM